MQENALRVLAERLNSNALDNLHKVKSIIDALNLHINSGNLSQFEIKQYISELTLFCFQTPLDIKLSKEQRIVRAVKFEGNDGIGHVKLSRLSYIPQNIGISPQLGRLNCSGESMFYACWGYDPNSIGAVLSEVKAKPGDIFNLLISKTAAPPRIRTIFDELLLVVPIGISDYHRRGVSHPFAKIEGGWHEFYTVLSKATLPEAMLTLQLTDAFMLDILKRKNHGWLYDITSALASEVLSAPNIDGAIYPSTVFDGFPSLALHPTAVDNKIKHEKVISIRVLEEFGYGIFKTEKLGEGQISGENIQWTKATQPKSAPLFQLQWAQ